MSCFVVSAPNVNNDSLRSSHDRQNDKNLTLLTIDYSELSIVSAIQRPVANGAELFPRRWSALATNRQTRWTTRGTTLASSCAAMSGAGKVARCFPSGVNRSKLECRRCMLNHSTNSAMSTLAALKLS